MLVAWAARDDDAVWAYSDDLDEHSRFNLSNVTHAAPGSWANYVRGVAVVLLSDGHKLRGIDMAIAGNIPAGAGLSSSAALEVAVAGAFVKQRDSTCRSIASQCCASARRTTSSASSAGSWTSSRLRSVIATLRCSWIAAPWHIAVCYASHTRVLRSWSATAVFSDISC